MHNPIHARTDLPGMFSCCSELVFGLSVVAPLASLLLNASDVLQWLQSYLTVLHTV